MKEFIQSIYDSSNDRIKSPLIGAYLTSFLIYNWRPISIFIFSNSTIECKIEKINAEYCVSPSLLWPLAIALFYVLILPYINMGIESLITVATQSRIKHRHSKKMFELQTKKEEVRIEKEVEDIRAGLQDIANLNNQLQQLQNEKDRLQEQHNTKIKSLENELNQVLLQNKKLTDDLSSKNTKSVNKNNLKVQALEIFESFTPKELDGFIDIIESFVSDKKPRKFEDIRLLETLMQRGLIAPGGSDGGKDAFLLTELGKEVYNYLFKK